ncbi:hypothetical protein LRS74_28150 [Streptomyces sp. LX-29]|uniref:hypothetical protein n=1 Tax=Streptomyces sp. LX-29 TaxID=2900152 RepID=UPI00240D51E2|nr:hypothetical protein [Streptomyces sp. LX-29]WFB10474.1 hypothetical protein LRS74_28150 [Streptomyces sp. LX-29]
MSTAPVAVTEDGVAPPRRGRAAGFAAASALGGLAPSFTVLVTARALVTHTRDKAGTRLGLPGAATISAGLLALVYGFSHAESRSWGSPMAWGFLAAGVILIVVFVLWQRDAPHMASAVRASPRSQAWAWSVS